LEKMIKAPYETLAALEGPAYDLEKAARGMAVKINLKKAVGQQARTCPSCTVVMVPTPAEGGQVRWDCMICPRACTETKPGVFHWEDR